MGISTQDAPALGIKEIGCEAIPYCAGVKSNGRGGYRPGSGRPAKHPDDRALRKSRAIPPVIAVPRTAYPAWIVIQTNPHSEHSTTHAITRAGWSVYLPLIITHVRDRVTPTIIHRVSTPRLRGYLLVELQDAHWAPLRYVDGVRAVLLNHSGQPWIVPASQIKALWDDDANHLHMPTAKPGMLAPHSPGLMVRITAGAFAGRTGAVIECNGLTTTVAMPMFGVADMPVPVDRALVEVTE